MQKNEVNKTRRSFFLKGTAALGAGLASAGAGAFTLFDPSQSVQEQMNELYQRLGTLEDREALNHLYLTLTTLLENRAYDAVAELFTEDASVELHDINLTGKDAVKKLFMKEYNEQKISAMHTAHRRDQTQKKDLISVGGNRKQAHASFYNQVLICKPIRGQSVLADMARQQGMTAQSYWENGRYDISFILIHDQWRISGLRYHKV
jgi:hypothetical protein